MFKFFRRTKPAKEITRSEFARTFNFEGKDFTRACVYRACHMQDAAVKELTNDLGKIRELETEKSLNELCASSIVTVASYITTEAVKKNDLESVFMPFKEAPKHVVLMIAFACLVSLFIKHQIDQEGIETEFDELAVRSAKTVFPFWEGKEMLPHILAGEKLFKEICSSDIENVIEWRSNLNKSTTYFILQWISEAEETKKVNFEELFGKLFKGALEVIN